ncbi:MAG: diacylglycerol kinase family protein [Candidatus Gastranaerophilales bacterium]|nr:diacylglycerol kinase family protein [Candidatus Gastranaerophilales bacterium]
MKNKTLLLNPSSRNGKGRKNWKYFLGQGSKKIITKNKKHLIDSAIMSDSETIVAVGGDGTINLVINGIMKSPNKKALGVLYSGTSPDFCKFHKIPVTPQEALNVLKCDRRKLIDIMKITYTKDNSTAYFASSCNIGVGAQMADIANKIRKFFGDKLGTLIAALVTVCFTKPFKTKINVDGREFEFSKVYHIMVFKNNFVASGLYVGLNTKPDDGKIYVLVIKNSILKFIFGLYNGKIPKDVFLTEGNKVFVEPEPCKKIEYDGDSHDYTPVVIECLNKVLELVK